MANKKEIEELSRLLREESNLSVARYLDALDEIFTLENKVHTLQWCVTGIVITLICLVIVMMLM